MIKLQNFLLKYKNCHLAILKQFGRKFKKMPICEHCKNVMNERRWEWSIWQHWKNH